MKRIIVVGAGGFAREVRWLIEEINAVHREWAFGGYVVSDVTKLGVHDDGDAVRGDLRWLEEHANDVDALAIGIGTPAARLSISAELGRSMPHVEWPALVHPSVRMGRSSCALDPGVLVCAGTIATVNVRFAAFSMVNLACTIGHEAVIGPGAVLNPTVNISGGVSLGSGVLVGTGAQILQYVRVGDGATVGAGAVVTKDVAPGATVVGIPAKPRA
jgi:sugar O-acyltransferase (sialic acid O-acetyltransferase NeuD family)